MRLLELEIENVRGIPEKIVLKPDGENFAIWGPNGSGKSTVVDALDFLLTGAISRLTGQGTGSISLSKHGPHVDHTPEEAWVRAKVKLKGVKDSVQLARCIARPKILECDDKIRPKLDAIIEIAEYGHHVLTRREILRYVTAEGSKRAEQIQKILSISNIEDIRTALVKVEHDLLKELQSADQAIKRAEATVAATLQAPKYNFDQTLEAVNRYRAVFGKPALDQLGPETLKADIALPAAVQGGQQINVTLVQNDIANLLKALDPHSVNAMASAEQNLRQILQTIRGDQRLLRDLNTQQLVTLGINLLDDSGQCPLCETDFPPGKLRRNLEARQVSAQRAQALIAQIETLTATLTQPLARFLASSKNLQAVTRLLDLDDISAELGRWITSLDRVLDALNVALEKYPLPQFSTEQISNGLAPEHLRDMLEKINLQVTARYPKTTPEQDAWDMLTRLEENLKSLVKEQENQAKSKRNHRQAQIIYEQFQKARDSVLIGLYNEIRDRFVDLYKSLHGDDEKDFQADFTPDGAALNFQVAFHGRGVHPPHALHSEGHQDSMGICLYLALAERLTGDVMDLVVLDDVVMSVDADHRRELCKLLVTAFPKRQFFITTHDRTWANQLRYEGVVKSKKQIEFTGWRIDTGPQINDEAEMWEKIRKDMKNCDIPSAAAKLRRGSEEFFSLVCDSLQAPVRFRLNAKWELGDLMPPAIAQYKRLLDKAKKAARRWNNQEMVAAIEEQENIASSIFTRSNVEQWAVNTNVHYTNWANFEQGDFEPVVDAFEDLLNLFRCPKCGGLLSLLTQGPKMTNLRCGCNQTNFNLLDDK